MARVEVGVAVIVEGSAAIEIQALRRALSDPSLPSIAPHVTLVPPLRLKDHDLPEAIRLLHRAAADFEPFTVTLGPPDTFAPVTSTVHLPVEDPAGSLGVLRAAVFRPPLHRELQHRFVGHVTLLSQATDGEISGALPLLRGYRTEMAVSRLALLVRREQPRRWETLVDVDLDGVRVVGAGVLAVTLAAGSTPEPEAFALIAAGSETAPDDSAAPTADLGFDGPPLVVTARREDQVVGVAWGRRVGDTPHGLTVAAHARNEGIGTLLRREWHFRAQRASFDASGSPER